MLPGSEIAERAAKMRLEDREYFFLSLVQKGNYVLPFSPYTLGGPNELTIFISDDALRLGVVGDLLRINASSRLAWSIAAELDCILPTARISDITHIAAIYKAPPCIQPPSRYMATMEAMIQHSKAVDEHLGNIPGISSTVGKDWVLSNKTSPERAANYGWHHRSAPHRGEMGHLNVWQPLSTAHNHYHVDYSQTVRLVQRVSHVDQGCWDILDTLKDPELCSKISSEGVIAGKEYPVTLPPKRTISAAVAPKPRKDKAPTKTKRAPNVTNGRKLYQAKNYRWSNRDEVNWVVIHTAEAIKGPTTAEALGKWVSGVNAPMASWHYAVDNDSITQSVLEEHVAYHCPGLNRYGIGIEHAGYAKQKRAEWRDSYNKDMLELSAQLVAEICDRWGIPAEFVNSDDLLEGKRGITGHREGSVAFKKSTHTDPGQAFPWDSYIARVREILDALASDAG